MAIRTWEMVCSGMRGPLGELVRRMLVGHQQEHEPEAGVELVPAGLVIVPARWRTQAEQGRRLALRELGAQPEGFDLVGARPLAHDRVDHHRSRPYNGK